MLEHTDNILSRAVWAKTAICIWSWLLLQEAKLAKAVQC